MTRAKRRWVGAEGDSATAGAQGHGRSLRCRSGAAAASRAWRRQCSSSGRQGSGGSGWGAAWWPAPSWETKGAGPRETALQEGGAEAAAGAEGRASAEIQGGARWICRGGGRQRQGEAAVAQVGADLGRRLLRGDAMARGRGGELGEPGGGSSAMDMDRGRRIWWVRTAAERWQPEW